MIGILAVLGVGYVLGAKAGRERYEQLRAWWQQAKSRTTEATQSLSNGSTRPMSSELEQRVGQGI